MGLFFLNRLRDISLNVEVACCNHIGKKRRKNEDNFFFQGEILPLENAGLCDVILKKELETKQGLLFAVFDGMGGEADGEIASYLAATACSNCGPVEAIHEMNRVVYEESQKRFNSMGSTAVMLYIKDQNVLMCNLGDSKAFYWGEEKLTQISKDHTDAEFLKLHGITGRKPALTQYLGMNPEEVMLEPFVVERKIQKGDCYLLCSDGLTDMLSEERISRILEEEETAWECAEKMKLEALENGGIDNITVIVVKIR